MFKEVMYLVPKVEPAELDKMEKSLGSRFGNVAKKFGKGLLAVLTGGGILGAAAGILDKIFNPLKAVQEAIDKSLHASDSLADQAKIFNTTPGELAKLQAFGKAKGLDAAEVNLLITKFQTAVTEATADPNKDTSVRKFVGNKDTAQAFLTFIENLSTLSKTDPNAGIRVQQEIFGERQLGKSGAFLQANFGDLNKQFSQFSPEQLTAAINKGAGLQEQRNNSQAVRDLNDILEKAKVINAETVTSLEKQKDIEAQRENAKIERTQGLIELQTFTDTAISRFETEVLPELGKIVTKLTEMADNLNKFAGAASFFRRMGLGKDK